MSRFFSYLNTAKEILSVYKGEEPFASFVKKYFTQHKKFGSKDRKQISHLCYCYFRLGKAAPPPPEGGIKRISFDINDRILIGLFLCSSESNETLKALKPEWNENVFLSLEQKCSILNLACQQAGVQYSTLNIFPWLDELSEGIDHDKFSESFLIQPDLFIRIRPHYAESVLLKLDKTGVEYEFISPFTVRLPNSFKTEQVFDINKEIVIQDYSSQQISHLLPVDHGKPVSVWDCCAASGGKSIMAYDVNPNIELTVSDIRESILINLKKRFAEASIKKYKSLVADLSSHLPFTRHSGQGEGHHSPFDLIIFDAPCSGSGTWSRTPEQLFYFNQEKIEQFSNLQKKIASNVIPQLKSGGHLLYITCSVFKRENEEIIEFIKSKFNLDLVRMEVLKGYDKKADTLFAALLQKPL